MAKKKPDTTKHAAGVRVDLDQDGRHRGGVAVSTTNISPEQIAGDDGRTAANTKEK